MRQDSPEFIDGALEAPRARKYHIDNGVIYLSGVVNSAYREAVVDQYAEQVERFIKPSPQEVTMPDNVIDLAEQVRRLALSSDEQQRSINDQEAA